MMYGTSYIVMYNDYTQKYREKYSKATPIVDRLRMISADTCIPTSMVNSVPSLINIPTFCNSRGTGKWNTREKGRYLTKSCYKSPYTNRTSIKRKVTTQNHQRRLHNDYGHTSGWSVRVVTSSSVGHIKRNCTLKVILQKCSKWKRKC